MAHVPLRVFTLLRANGEDVKVVQELLRHANSKITMDIYTQALSPAKRQAQSRVASIILPKKAESAAAYRTVLDSCVQPPNPISALECGGENGTLIELFGS